MTPPRRQKYRAARAFYLVLLVFSIIAAWNVITENAGGRGGEGGRAIQRRFESTVLHSTKKHAVFKDKEVFLSIPWGTSTFLGTGSLIRI